MMKKGWFVIGLVFALLIGPAILASADTVVVVDQAGNPVTIERPVDRIVSIDGIGTYYVYALGRGDSLVAAWYIGVKGLEKAPEGLFRLEPRLPEILRFGDPNVEEMVSLDPDLIIVNGSRHGAFAAQMNDLGVPTIQLLVETPGALKDSLRLIAAAIGGDTIPRAEALVADYDRVFDTVETSLSGLPESRRPRVLFIGTDKLRVASGDMYQTYLIEVSGGVSITSGLSGYWNDVNLEQVLLWDPDVIVIAPYGGIQPEDILTDPDWQAISAVENGRVYKMPRVLAAMDTPVPESLLGVVWMANLLYPDLVPLDLATEAEHFYSTYYDYELTDEELVTLLGE